MEGSEAGAQREDQRRQRGQLFFVGRRRRLEVNIRPVAHRNQTGPPEPNINAKEARVPSLLLHQSKHTLSGWPAYSCVLRLASCDATRARSLGPEWACDARCGLGEAGCRRALPASGGIHTVQRLAVRRDGMLVPWWCWCGRSVNQLLVCLQKSCKKLAMPRVTDATRY